jgi:hypothetical protein
MKAMAPRCAAVSTMHCVVHAGPDTPAFAGIGNEVVVAALQMLLNE